MKYRKSVSSRDVAREAGVSQATVSYVLNNVKDIKIRPETREAVLEAVKRLNYHPNHIARGMKLNRSMSIGVVTDRNITNFYFAQTLEGIKDGIQQNNYSITLTFDRSSDIADMEFIRYFNTNRIDGIIFAFAAVDDRTIDYLNEKDIPCVIVDAHPRGRDAYEVCTDHLNHMSDVFMHFRSKGVNSVGYAGPGPGVAPDRRVEAFREAAGKNGYKISDRHIVFSVFDDDEITKAVTGLLSSADRPEAVLAGSPRFGLLTLKCALMLGIKVPEELKIIAFGSSNFFVVTHPALSAVEVPLYEMGIKASEKLFSIMNGDAAEKTTILPSQLLIRDSS
jgi:DNA-binding LacI/PurR family transcriptional regulator